MAKLCLQRKGRSNKSNPSLKECHDEREKHMSQNEHSVSKRQNKFRKTDIARYISVDIEVRSKPRDECVIRNGRVEHQVAMTGLVMNGNSSESYVIRFTHKNEVDLARKLMIGQRIRVTRGRYFRRFKGAATEFHVRESELRSLFETNRRICRKLREFIPDLVLRIGRRRITIQLR
jgi:hypothetical protein